MSRNTPTSLYITLTLSEEIRESFLVCFIFYGKFLNSDSVGVKHWNTPKMVKNKRQNDLLEEVLTHEILSMTKISLF